MRSGARRLVRSRRLEPCHHWRRVSCKPLVTLDHREQWYWQHRQPKNATRATDDRRGVTVDVASLAMGVVRQTVMSRMPRLREGVAGIGPWRDPDQDHEANDR